MKITKEEIDELIDGGLALVDIPGSIGWCGRVTAANLVIDGKKISIAIMANSDETLESVLHRLGIDQFSSDKCKSGVLIDAALLEKNEK